MAHPTDTGRTQAVMAAIRARLAGRALAPGEKLPSVRRLAASLGVSPSTVVVAYDRLVAEGLVLARPGSGFYAASAAPLPAPPEPPPREREIDPLWVSRQSLDAAPALGMPGCGWLPASWMPHGAIRRALRGLARAEDKVLVEYGGTRGAPALRHLLLRQFAREGLEIGPEQLLLTSSDSQALDLVCRLLLRPGDAVLLDDPCYFNFQALLRLHQARVVPVPYTPSGPDLARFGAALAAHRPRLYITNSALQNPTGASLAPPVAHRLLTLAAAHGLTIVEDDIFADLEPEPSPRLAVLDGLSRVIRLGSFSKTLSASARCGYIAARPDWAEALADLQVATGFGGPSPISVELVTRTLADGSYRKHLEGLHRRLARARREVGARLGALGIEPWARPRGGFYLWCRLPEGRDAARMARAALREGLVLAPGPVFSLSEGAEGFMRFNVAQMGDAGMDAVLRRALEG